MKQLTVGDILNYVSLLKKSGMGDKAIASLPVYIGDDDELNGIHTAWYTNLIDVDEEEDADLIELINENRCNIKIDGKALLIS